MPLSAWEIWACANTVLKIHGNKAPLHVAEQIGALALKGDQEGIHTWQEIAVRIDVLIAQPSATDQLQ